MVAKHMFRLSAAVIGLSAISVLGQTSPSTSPSAKELTATVTGVVGYVQARTGDDRPWEKAVVGMVLPAGGEFRTGPRAAVRFTLPGGQTITLDRLGTMKILTAVEQNGKITTDLGMKYGRTRYDIQKAGVEYSSTIRSPGSTLAIRGTDVTYEDQPPWSPSATSVQGRAQFKNLRNEFISFGGVTKAQVDTGHQGPGDIALDQTGIDAQGHFSGHDTTETKVITEYPLLSGLNPTSSSSILQLLQSTQTRETVNTPLLTGPLEFNLVWQSVNVGNGVVSPTDLNLAITDPQGRIVSKNNPMAGSGSAIGVFSGDDKGTAGSGAESVVWGQNFRQGQYQINVNNAGGDPAQAIVDVSRQNQDIKSIGVDPKNPLILTPGQSFTTTIDVGAAPDSGQTTASSNRRKRGK